MTAWLDDEQLPARFGGPEELDDYLSRPSRALAVDLAALANLAASAGGAAQLCERIMTVNTAAEAFALAAADGIGLGDTVARAAQHTAAQIVAGHDIAVEIVLFDREQNLVGRAPFET